MLRSGCDIGVFQIGLFYQISKNDIVFCISRNNNPYPPAVFEILLDCFPQISYYVHLLENIRVRFVSSLFHCKCIESLHKKQQKINVLQHNYPLSKERFPVPDVYRQFALRTRHHAQGRADGSRDGD